MKNSRSLYASAGAHSLCILSMLFSLLCSLVRLSLHSGCELQLYIVCRCIFPIEYSIWLPSSFLHTASLSFREQEHKRGITSHHILVSMCICVTRAANVEFEFFERVVTCFSHTVKPKPCEMLSFLVLSFHCSYYYHSLEASFIFIRNQ